MQTVLDVRTLTAGTVVAGRYRVTREIGRGSMGVVYAVERVDSGEPFAMKLLVDGGLLGDRAERFRREARASARVVSEHVVRIVDADTARELDGAPFLVMELLDGSDLEKVLEARGKLDPPEVIDILLQVGRALERAHTAGVIHRDLKPENVFLHRRDDGTVIVKVLDFGISKILGRESDASIPCASPAIQANAPTQVMGTPLYMAPEQASARHGDVAATTDVWALGMLAVRMLTGDHYWNAESITELVIQILADERTPPSAKFPSFTPALDAWFARSCATHPGDRFATVVEQVSALALVLTGERVEVRSSYALDVDPMQRADRVSDVRAREDSSQSLLTTLTKIGSKPLRRLRGA